MAVEDKEKRCNFFLLPTARSWAVGPLMLSFALYATSSVAQAQMLGDDSNLVVGHWQPYFKILSGKALAQYSRSTADSGKGSYIFNFAAGNYGEYETPNNSGKSGAHVNSGGKGGAASSFGSGGAASLNLSDLVVQVTYKWEYPPHAADAQLEPAPSKLNFVLNGSATASAYSKTSWGYPVAERDTSGEKVSVSVNGKSSPEDAKTYVFLSSGRLFSFDTQGQTTFVGTIPIKAQASIPGNRNTDTGDISSDFDFSSKLDDRSVSLSRAGAINEWPTNEGGVPVTNGDTIYSFTEHQSAQTPEWVPVPQKFTSALAGNWSTGFAPTSGGYDITWNWNASGLEEYNNILTPTSRQADASSYTRWNGISRVTPKGELESWYGFLGNTAPNYTDEGNPKRKGRPATTATVKYFVRDNQDQAEAEARYKLTVHEPVELVGGKQLVKQYNVTTPARFQDPQDGKWKLVSSLIGDTEHTYQPGEYSYTVVHGAAKGQGYTVGFEGGVALGIEAVVGYNHSAEMSWSKEHGGTATLSEVIRPGESAYLEVVFPRQVLKQDYRLFTAAGENRSSESLPVPAPSIPYNMRWEESVSAPTQRWNKLKKGEMLPTNESELPTAQGNSGGSS